MSNYEKDKPIERTQDDKLHRLHFAKTIANTIKTIANKDSEGIVLGIFGKWGDGKTSLINLIKEFLSDDSEIQKTENTLYKYLKKIKCFFLKRNISFYNICSFIVKLFIITVIFSLDFIDLLFDINFIDKLTNNSTFLSILFGNHYIYLFIKFTLSMYILIAPTITFNWLLDPIKYIFYKLKQFIKPVKNTKNIIYTDFSPWNTTSEDGILNDFFNTIKQVLIEKTDIPDIKDTLNSINNYTNILCNNTLNMPFNLFSENKDIQNIKNSLKQKLDNIGQKIIVFMDDIDRLTDKEMLLIFKLIKSIADFPNIIYIISFDRQIAENVLRKYYSDKENKFIDKIVQLGFHIPKIRDNDIETYLIDSLNRSLNNYQHIENSWQKKYQEQWNQIIYYKFSKVFKNIRDIKKYINTLNLTYNENLYNEINYIDFMVITTFQVCMPKLYNFIKNNQRFFIHDAIDKSIPYQKEQIEVYKKELFNIIDEYKNSCQADIVGLLITLFPNISAYFPKGYFSLNQSYKYLYKNGRICCSEHFQNFFIYDIDEEEISLTEMNAILKLAYNKEDFSKKLLELNNNNRIEKFFTKFRYETMENLGIEYAKNIVKSFFDIGDFLNIFDTKEFFSFNRYATVRGIIYEFFELNLENKFQFVSECINNNKSLYIAMDYIRMLKSSFREDNTIKQNYISKQECDLLCDEIMRQIYEWADNDLKNIKNADKPFDGQLHKHKGAYGILFFWYNNGHRENLTKYISSMTNTDEKLLNFLKIFQYKFESYSSFHSYTGYKINIDDLKKFFNIDDLKQRILNIDVKDLSKEHTEILKRVLDTIENAALPHDEFTK